MNSHPCPPPFTYFGGKTNLAGRIAALLPAHEHYVEPFAGSLAVLLAKPPSHQETANDLDGKIVNFFRVLRDQPDELIRVCALTPHSRTEHEMSWKGIADDSVGDVELARRAWVALTQGRGRTLGHLTGGWWYHPAPGQRGTVPANLAAFVERMAPVAERLKRVTLECRPALDVVAEYGGHAGNLLYVDPPYLGQTRNVRDKYAHEMKGEAEHRELAEALLSCRSAVVLSGYDSPLYRELYSSWDRLEIATETGNGKGDRSRVEVLWSNRPFPVARQEDLFAVS